MSEDTVQVQLSDIAGLVCHYREKGKKEAADAVWSLVRPHLEKVISASPQAQAFLEELGALEDRPHLFPLRIDPEVRLIAAACIAAGTKSLCLINPDLAVPAGYVEYGKGEVVYHETVERAQCLEKNPKPVSGISMRFALSSEERREIDFWESVRCTVRFDEAGRLCLEGEDFAGLFRPAVKVSLAEVAPGGEPGGNVAPSRLGTLSLTAEGGASRLAATPSTLIQLTAAASLGRWCVTELQYKEPHAGSVSQILCFRLPDLQGKASEPVRCINLGSARATIRGTVPCPADWYERELLPHAWAQLPDESVGVWVAACMRAGEFEIGSAAQ